ncbi:MAG: MBL fold metallo-hydrolase [Planctomycetota bacterium]
MKIRFWGVRGSIPVPGPATARYGGNTACLEVTGAGGECIILDAGTGARALGLDLARRKPLPPIYLFISHTHWDHIQGLPFFVPGYVKGAEIHVRGPVHFVETKSLKEIFDHQMRYEFFPISNIQLGATFTYDTMKEGALSVGGIALRSQFTNHPIRSLAYRLEENGKSLVYTGDHEPYQNIFAAPAKDADDDLLFGSVDATVEDANRRFVEFIRGADLLVADSQYTPAEYPATKRGWGHASWDWCLRWMKEGAVKRMILTHHDPARTDETLDKIQEEVRTAAKGMGLDPAAVEMAREGMEVTA